MKKTIGIIGNGFVGKATKLLFSNVDSFIYDINPKLCEPVGLTLSKMLDKCLVIFICVPTPMDRNGKCCLDFVEGVYKELLDAGMKQKENIVVLRSTVPAGTSDKYGFCFMPEYLTELNWRDDVLATKQVFLGLSKDILNNADKTKNIAELFKDLLNFESSKKLCRQVVTSDTLTFELQKIFCNSFLATKVGFCNEFKEFCDRLCLDEPNGKVYNRLISNLRHDDRLGTSHFAVPGPDGQNGFGGTCFPKDIHSLESQMKIVNNPSPIISAVITRNETLDRPNKDWLQNKGRAII